MTKELQSDRERAESPGMDGGQIDQAYAPATQPSFDVQTILDQIAGGEFMADVAQTIGVPTQTVSWRLRKIAPEKYREAREIGCELRLEKSRQSLEVAGDALDLARARESFRADAWFAEREFPARWGAKQQIDMRVTTTDLGDRLRAAKERVVGTGSTVADAQQKAASAAQQLPIAQDLTSTSK